VRESVPSTRHDKRSEVVAVASQQLQKGNMIRVHTLFEPDPLERASLQRAYERILPIRQQHARDEGRQGQTEVVYPPQRRMA
jgi:hypothetical protein